MKIALIDVDGHNFPNLPLMKLSTWHKKHGDNVDWYEPLTAWYEPPDIVYMSKVFTFTPDYNDSAQKTPAVRKNARGSITENRVYKCKSCSYRIACVPNATKSCDQCGQSFYWEEK